MDKWAIVQDRVDRNANNVRKHLQKIIRDGAAREGNTRAQKSKMELYFPYTEEEGTDWATILERTLTNAAPSSGRSTDDGAPQQVTIRTEQTRR
jgi:hypothetical protein